MPFIQQYFHVIGAFNCFVFFVILFTIARKCEVNRVLGGWCLALSIYLLTPLVLIHLRLYDWFYLLAWGFWLPSTFAGFLYLYLRTAVTGKTVSSRDLVIFVPFGICLIVNFDTLIASREVIITVLQKGIENDWQRVVTQFVLNSQMAVFIVLSYRLVTSLRTDSITKSSQFQSYFI